MINYPVDCSRLDDALRFCDPVRHADLILQALLVGAFIGAPALLALAISLSYNARLVAWLYLAGAAMWTLMILSLYRRDVFNDGHGCEYCVMILFQFALNWIWLLLGFPIGMVIWAYWRDWTRRSA